MQNAVVMLQAEAPLPAARPSAPAAEVVELLSDSDEEGTPAADAPGPSSAGAGGVAQLVEMGFPPEQAAQVNGAVDSIVMACCRSTLCLSCVGNVLPTHPPVVCCKESIVVGATCDSVGTEDV